MRKSYDHIRAVAGIDLNVRPGEVVSFLGPNGAGKSTAIDMLLGLTHPDAGSVSVWGRTPQEASRAGMVGAMLQEGGLLARATVAELVDAVRNLSPHPLPLAEVLRTAQVEEFAGQMCDRLSGGQVQRVRFALAIAGNPDLLVLDEPTVAMDVTTRRAFWASMREWTDRGRTVFFATHYLEEADAYADRVILIAKGRIVADGSIADVKAAVGGRTVKVTVEGSDSDLGRLPGVTSVERRGSVVLLHCADSDRALRELLAAYPDAHDIEVKGVGLEDAFMALTGDGREHETQEVA